ncbi:MAG: polyprenyl synthetase family protein [Deltaproteobacteria bacterium]|jgi:geranylgeranyl pyrophosphate synthase|nr:polyprenyl synthetase family protein [Deltaproteobacteria bacterium]
MSVRELTEWRERTVGSVNALLARTLRERRFDPDPKNLPARAANNLLDAMAHTVQSGGKRIRALLTLAVCEAVSGDHAPAMHAAAAVELVHAYSLIHDDLPALDDDDLRRGRPACHIAYGEATAILAGDALQSLAFELLAAPVPGGDSGRGGAPRTVLALSVLASSIGPRGMAGGQAMDLALEGAEAREDDVTLMEAMKTGALFGAAMGMGAALGGADGGTVDLLRAQGAKVGVAFQIADDLLNVSGDPSAMGKRAGTDAKLRKASMTSVSSPADCAKLADFLIGDALAGLGGTLPSRKIEWLVSSAVKRTS